MYRRATEGGQLFRHAKLLTIAKLPLAKDLDDFKFAGTPINETLVKDLAGGGFIAQERNVVLVGGTDDDSECSPRDIIRKNITSC